jgi:hypothetical protein
MKVTGSSSNCCPGEPRSLKKKKAQRDVMRYLWVLALGLPVAGVFGFNAGLLAGGGEAAARPAVWTWFLSLVVISLYASRPRPLRQVLGRIVATYAVSAFALPISGLVFIFFGDAIRPNPPRELAERAAELGVKLGESPQPLGLQGFDLFSVLAGFGLITGLISLKLVFVLLRKQR